MLPQPALRANGKQRSPLVSHKTSTSEHVAAVFLLTLILHGPAGQTVRTKLPCPRRDFVTWLAAEQTGFDSSIVRLLHHNPTLLLTAVSQAVKCSGDSVTSPRQLVTRLQHCFNNGSPLETLLDPVVAVEELKSSDFKWNAHFHSALKTFHGARSQHDIIRSLARFARLNNKAYLSKTDQTKKRTHRALFQTMFGDAFRLPKVTSKRSDDDWKPTSNRVRTDSAPSTDVVLVSLLADRASTQSTFESKLLDAKLLAMKQLAYGASHEINNPLANIATRAQAMLTGETDPDRRYRLAVIHEQAMRAHDMISDMMLFAHPPQLKCKPTDIRLMLARLKRECESNFACLAQTEIELRITVGVNVSHASLDGTQCVVLLASLIRNAAEAMRDDEGEIEVSVWREKDQLCFCVADNGIGIDDHVKPHLFDPFYSGREAGRGLGFGLPKSWRIASLHGGSLTHEPTRDELGTRFVFRLPVTS